MLQKLAARQEEYKALLIDLKKQEDKSFVEGYLSNADNIAVNLATCFDALLGEESDPISEQKILWAMEFMDHLDTMNLKIVPKWQRVE